MKFWIFLILGLLTVMEILYKLMRCASCDASYLGFDLSGYTYLFLQTLIGGILFYSAYNERMKTRKST